ncbi:TetR/AcrR family transcriptional regulator [Canibacter zhoujuaniae]|uniref:TetR/AcrR family transcriptional regulator n=1 Tax=Canibacter zhoujuaniae TaxID=2708343 RepID=UPI00141FEDDC|nr:TetR/AcrR family transcriptional regulator [Canibacter zhoujuaniae]
MPRPTTAKLTPEKIAKAALAQIDAGGEVNMLQLAKRLRVSVSSIYHHVPSKEAVLSLVRRQLLAAFKPHIDPAADWETGVLVWIRASAKMYSSHPHAAQYLAQLPLCEEEAAETYGALFELLRKAGVAAGDAVALVEVIDAFVIGAAIDASSPASIYDAVSLPEEMRRAGKARPSVYARNTEVIETGAAIFVAGIRAHYGLR